MPQVAGFAAAAFSYAVGGAAVAGSAAGVVGVIAAGTALQVAAQVAAVAALTALLAPKVGNSGPPTEWVADPNAPIHFAAGRIGAAGRIVHKDEYGPNNMYQTLVTVLSGAGPIKSFVSFTGDDTAVSFTSEAATSSQWAGEMWMQTRRGLQPETAHTSPTGLTSSATLPGWTSANKLSGQASYMLTLAENSKQSAYSGGEPKPLWTIEGLYGYDPRLDSTYPGGSGTCRLATPSTWVYLTNPILWALKWALGLWESPTGYGAPYVGYQVGGIGAKLDGIDVAAFVEAANIADANGWIVAAYPSTDDNKAQVLDAFLQAGGAVYAQKAGKISCIHRAAPRTSVVTISAADTAGPIEVNTTASRVSRINTLRPQFWSEADQWQMIAIDEVTDAAWLAEDGGKRSRGIDFPYVPNKDQCAQLAYLQTANTREPYAGTIPLKPHLQNIKPGDAFTITEPGFVLDGLKCLCLNTEFDAGTGTHKVSFVSDTDAKYSGLAATGTAPTVPTITPVDPTYVAPPGGSEWAATAESIVGDDGSTTPTLVFSGAVTNARADTVVFEYRRNGGTDWQSVGVEGPNATIKEIPLANGEWQAAVSYRIGSNNSTRLVLGPVTLGGAVVGVTQPETGAITESVNTVLARLPVYPEQYGAVGDGTTDDTAALQAALNTGRHVILALGKIYKHTSTLTISTSYQVLECMGYLRTHGAIDGVLVTGGAVGVILDLVFSSPNQTAGWSLKVANAHRVDVRRWNGIDVFGGIYVEQCNTATVTWAWGACRGPGIKWYGSATKRSDILSIAFCVMSIGAGHYGLDWDGNCHSLEVKYLGMVCSGGGYGAIIRNTSGGTDPAIGRFSHIEIDYPTGVGIEILVGQDYDFAVPYVLGATASGLKIAAIIDTGQVRVVGGKIRGCARYGIENLGGPVWFGGATDLFDNTLGQVYGNVWTNTPRVAFDDGFYVSAETGNPLMVFDTNDYLAYDRTGNSLFLTVGGATIFTASGTDFVSAVNLTAPRFALDATGYFTLSSGNPLLVFDAGDYIGYDRTSNAYFLTIGGATIFTATTTGFTSTVNVTAPRFAIDSTAYFTLSTGNPLLVFDATDYIGYDRTGNALFLTIGGNTMFIVSAALFESYYDFKAPKVFVADSSFYLTTVSSQPYIVFDGSDYLAYNRTTNDLSLVIGGATAFSATSSLFSATGVINAGASSGYKQGGTNVLYASSVNFGTSVGLDAGRTNLTSATGTYNTAIGYRSLYSASLTGTRNTAIGSLSLTANTTAEYNTGVGASTLVANTTGSYNNAIGFAAMSANTTGIENNAMGYQALSANVSGQGNSAVGSIALFYKSAGNFSTAIGWKAGRGLATYTSTGGTIIGANAGLSNATGSDYNTLVGYQSGYGVTTGARNVLIGQATITASHSQVTTGSNNIAIGNDVAVPTATASDQLVIGNLIYGTGLSGTGATISTGGKIGVGIKAPAEALDVVGNIKATGSITPAGGLSLDATASLALSSGNPLLVFDANDYLAYNRTTNDLTTYIGGTAIIVTSAATIQHNKPTQQNVLTVATLPTGVAGMRSFVSDATASTFASVVVGGGAIKVPVYSDGTNWLIG